VKARALTAVVAALLSLGVVTACDSNAGVAATVGDHRITDSDVAKYVRPSGADPSIVANAASAGTTLQPKVYVLDLLIKQELFEQALRSDGGVPSAGELAALHDAAVTAFLGVSQDQVDQIDSYLDANQGPNGYSSRYRDLLLRTVELELTLAQRVDAQTQQDLTKSVDKLNIPISVSGRYGSWDAANLQMSVDPSAGVPSFVNLNGGASPSAPATAAAG
jgi:hypothetical protein